MPILIDSGSPLSVLPSEGALSVGDECIELRAAGGLLDNPGQAALDATTASFRLRGAPVVRVPEAGIAGWSWEAGDELTSASIGGVIGGNVLRDFAVEFRHLDSESPSVAFFTDFPGSEQDLGDQGRAYLRLQFPGRLLGRLIDDRCEIGLDCEVSAFVPDQNNRTLLFESSRALLDACVAPPPCALQWKDEACTLESGGVASDSCSSDIGASATLVVATGAPGLVLFEDSATALLGPLELLPSCAEVGQSEARACMEGAQGRLALVGWPPLEGLVRLRVRALGLLEGLDQSSGQAPCQRLRGRLQGLTRQCRGFALEGLPVRPEARSGQSVGDSALVLGEIALGEAAAGPDTDAWLPTLIVPETAPMVLALRREIVPEGAQPDGLIGSALLRNTETVLDFTESIESPGVRVRCLDPGGSCLALPACTASEGPVAGQVAGRTSCCYGLPTSLISQVVLEGESKEAPRIEDACCPALSRAAFADLSDGLDLCTGYDPP